MILLYIFVLSLLNAEALEGPSYRSSVMEGGRPILRMPPDEPTEETEVVVIPESSHQEEVVTTEPSNEDPKMGAEQVEDEKLVKDLSLLIAWLVERLGYDLVQDVRRQGENAKKIAALRNGELKKTHETDPNWLTDLKSYMKDLVSQYGKSSLDKYTKPIVKSVEKKQNVVINDIDGEVFVTYEKNSKKKVKSVKEKEKIQEQKQSTEESVESKPAKVEPVEHVTEMLQRRIFV